MKQENMMQIIMIQTLPYIIGLIPLCMSVLVTAVVLEQANIIRSQTVSEDALPPPLTDFIPLSVWVFLVIGYLISLVILITALVHLYRTKE